MSSEDDRDTSPLGFNDENAQELTREEKEQKLNELITSGRRFIKLGEYINATDVLSDAAELSGELYGENHENTFDSIYYYAIATFEYGKQEAQLLLSKQQNPEESEEPKEGEPEKPAEEKNGDDSDDDASDEKEDGEEDDEVEDDEDSMKLAWELLETVRCIAEVKVEQLEQENGSAELISEWQLKKADILVLLGEHGIADGKYAEAQTDLTRGLEIQKTYLPSPDTSRCIAQTYMLIGNACNLDARFDEAITYYQKTEEMLNGKVVELVEKLKNETDKKVQAELKEELEELEAMKPEVSALVADSITSAAQQEEVKKQMKAQYEGIASVIAKLPQEDDETETNDISSMVRRPAKRAAVGTEDESADDSKKSKEEGTSDL